MSYGSVDDTIRYLINRRPIELALARSPAKNAGSVSIDQILNDRVESLATILADIQGTIDKRGDLSADVIKRIYAHYFYVKKYLFEITHWPLSGNRAIEQRRSQLESKLDTLLNEKRREQVLCFQDVANLKRDFWKWFKEYSDLMQRARFVSKNGPRPSSRR